MRDIEQYNNFSASDYFDAVVLPNEAPVEAVYYLLQRRLHRALYHVFELHGFGLSDDFNDTIDDFFLYLYDGNNDSDRPFDIVSGIQNKQAFFGWTVSTYRNFLLNKAKEEIKRKTLQEESLFYADDERKGLSEEIMMDYMAAAIAYADQCFKPCNLFIFYRIVLSLLDHSRAIPQEEMAKAMKLHPVTYRVRSKRQRDCFQRFILSLEAGGHLDLDSRHELMRVSIFEDFKQLYDLLIGYYNSVLELLSTKDEIKALRLKYHQERGVVMHENNLYGYRFKMNVRTFYNALKSYSTSCKKSP